MKKICFVTTIPLTLRMFVVKTAKYLHENTDWDISFICNYDESFAKELPEYIHYHPVAMERGISFKGINAMLEMKKIFEREKFDLVQYSTPNASLYASMAAMWVKVPVRLYCQWGMAYVGFTGMKRWIFKQIEKTVCYMSTWIEPDSYSNLKFAHTEGLYSATKSSVIWNGSACGIDLDKFDISKKEIYRNEIRNKFNIPTDAYVFGFVGRVTRDKGVNELLTAYKEISVENTYLMMIGPEEVDETIDPSLYQWSRKNTKIVYTGFTSEVEKYLSAMDCYILPSYREGFGMGTVEAEAMGVPVIVTKIPGPIDAMVADQTGLQIDKADAGALQNAMIQLLQDRELGLTMGAKGTEFARDRFEQKKLFHHILVDRKRLMKD